MKKIIRSRPMKLASNKKARSSGFMTSKSIRRTATVPYLFIHGCRFMRLIPSASDECKEAAVQQLQILLAQEDIARHERLTGNHIYGSDDWFWAETGSISLPERLSTVKTLCSPFTLFSPQCCACIKLESSDGRIAEFAMPRGRRRSRTIQGGHAR